MGVADGISRDGSDSFEDDDAGTLDIWGESIIGGKPDRTVEGFVVDSLLSDWADHRFLTEPSLVFITYDLLGTGEIAD